MGRVGKNLLGTAVVIAEPTVHGTPSSVKRFLEVKANTCGERPLMVEGNEAQNPSKKLPSRALP
jgi:hypothetical protein